jgi:hypothetical protein
VCSSDLIRPNLERTSAAIRPAGPAPITAQKGADAAIGGASGWRFFACGRASAKSRGDYWNCGARAGSGGTRECFRAKWEPVRVKKTR